MKPIISPLKFGDHGADVANLQDALLLLVDKGIIQLSERQSFKAHLYSHFSWSAWANSTPCNSSCRSCQPRHKLCQPGSPSPAAQKAP
jgi:hypothetical protein